MELWKAIKKHKPACVPLHSFLPPLHLSLEHQNKAVPCKIACYWMSLVPIQGGSINSAMPFMVLIYTPKFPSRGKTSGRHNSWQGGCKACCKCSPAIMKAARKKWLQVWRLSNCLTEWKKGRWGWELLGKYLEKTIRKRGQALADDRNKWAIRIYPVPEVRQETRTSQCLYSCAIKSLEKHLRSIPIIAAIFITSRLDGINSGIS